MCLILMVDILSAGKYFTITKHTGPPVTQFVYTVIWNNNTTYRYYRMFGTMDTYSTSGSEYENEITFRVRP